jgi:nucleotide-binding universal stress UspA family protein
MEVKTILWPTDFSRAAAAAEAYVVSLSLKYGAEVHLLHVAEDLAQFEHYWGSGPDAKHVYELHKYGMKLARERLEELCRTKLSGCPRYQIHIILGDPATQILKTAKDIDADLIVIATHGMRSLFPFGSVAERVIKNSPVPVFTVRPEGK